MSESLLRQRRNIFVICIIIWILCIGKVEISNLTFAGIQFSAFKNPAVVFVGAWIAFAYFAYRYFVYFWEESRTAISGVLQRELERAVNPRIHEMICIEYPDYQRTPAVSYGLLRKNGCHFIYAGTIQFRESSSSYGPIPIEVKISRWNTFPWEFKGVATFLFFTPAVTDYFLPIVFALGTLIYCGLWANWPGSLHIAT